MTDSSFSYSGTELELFKQAIHWKKYWSHTIRKYIGKQVLEVGAGIGGNTRLLYQDQASWLALEPDQSLFNILNDGLNTGELPSGCQVRQGVLAELPDNLLFDTILYIDVLEHIQDDQAELAIAARHLLPGGHLIVLGPAHQWLYTPFDRAIGHFRRYSHQSLLKLTPHSLSCVASRYLDSVGLLASLGNRLILKASQPTYKQIYVWDRYMVRLSRWLDPLFRFRVGKSVVVVWQK